MKKYLLILPLLLIGGKGFSQENTTQVQQTAENYQKAEFPGGDQAFQKEFMNMVHAYIDMALYAIREKLPLCLILIPEEKSARSMFFRNSKTMKCLSTI